MENIFEKYKKYWNEKISEKSPEATTRMEGAPHARGGLGALLAHFRYSVGFFWSKHDLCEISAQLDSVWYSFFAKLKNKEKQKLALGSRLIG